MENIITWDLSDFNYNGKWLSSFTGVVINFDSMPIFPDLNITTSESMNDGELLDCVEYKSRKLSLPCIITDSSKYFEITGWLNNKKPSPFYFKDSGVKLNANVSGLKASKVGNKFELNIDFIVVDPFWYLIKDNRIVFNRTNDSIVENQEEVIRYIRTDFTNELVFENDGNMESLPIITIEKTDMTPQDIDLLINGEPISLKQVSNTVIIDSKYMTVIDGNINKLGSFLYDFPKLNKSLNRIQVTKGNTKIKTINIKCRSRFI